MLWAEIVGLLQKRIWNLLYLLQLRGKFAGTCQDIVNLFTYKLFIYLSPYPVVYVRFGD
jgi:hypothetical protein